MGRPSFTRAVIGELNNEVGPAQMNTFFNVGDINRDGRIDIIVSGRNGRMAWFENRGETASWVRHEIDAVEHLECGGLAYDLTGSGYPDVINGSDSWADALFWWENPGKRGPSGGHWTRRVIHRTGDNQFHDEQIGDVTGDGRRSLVFWNQKSATLYWAPLPPDPRASPWPNVRVIAGGMRSDPYPGREQGLPEEGLAIADIDGDGRNEIIAGTHWYKYTGKAGAQWEVNRFAPGTYISTVVAVGDIDGDGRTEILLSEGDACIYGRPQGGRFAWFKPGGDIRALWEQHVVEDFLLDPHSLQVGDICGNGRQDVLVGEIGVKDRLEERPPRLLLFENDGAANFTRHVIDEGVGVHHARLADFRGKGVQDIASRPLHGPDKWKIFVWYNDRPAR